MSVLFMGAKAKEDLANLKAFAEANPFDEKALKAMVRGDHPPPGDYDDFVVKIDLGWRVVYSIEKHPIGWCRHVSVSHKVGDPPVGRVPELAAVMLIAKELGFSVTNKLHPDRGRPFPDPVDGWFCPSIIEPVQPVTKEVK